MLLALLFVVAPSFVCSEDHTGAGSCYGALGSVEHFTSRTWGGDIFLAQDEKNSFHCTAGDSHSELFARGAAAQGMVAISWDRYHRCISLDIEKSRPKSQRADAKLVTFLFR